MNEELQKQCNEWLRSIKSLAENVNYEPDAWTLLEDRTKQMYNWVDSMNNGFITEYLVSTISKDMLLSFLVCLQGNPHPISYRVLTMLEQVDKKWVGPFDEEMAGNLIDSARLEVNNILYGLSFLNAIEYFIGLIKYGYFDKFDLEPNFEDIRWMKSELTEFLINGTYMDSDEHLKTIELQSGVFGSIWSSPNAIVSALLNVGLNYMQRVIDEIRNSPYDHNNLDHRLFARDKFAREMIYEISKKCLENGDLRRCDSEYLRQSVIVKNEPVGTATWEQYEAALSPLADIVFRCIMEGHIMSGVRMSNMKTFSMIIDTIMMRRNLENERTYIKYQESIGKQDVSYAASLFSNKRRTRYAGQGMWK